jgi:AAA+ ATPase superfamily predicted ATPase
MVDWSGGATSGDFFDREEEMARLEAAWTSPGAQLVTLWGRRRVGKTTLLTRFASGRRSVYLYGTRMAERDVLQGLSFQAAASLGDAHLRCAPLGTWADALAYLAARSRDGRLLVVLDEFPYLCDVSRGLDTVVQRWWDVHHETADVVLVLAGSGFSFMNGLSSARGALHGRRTAQVEIGPFDYRDAAAYYPELDPEDRIRAYACLGGIPAYARHWSRGSGLAGNIARQRRTLHPLRPSAILPGSIWTGSPGCRSLEARTPCGAHGATW